MATRPPKDAEFKDRVRARQCVLAIGIDGERMDQRCDIRKPQARHPLARRPPGSGEGAEIAVGEGQNDEIGRALPQIPGRAGFFEAMAFAKDDMHR